LLVPVGLLTLNPGIGLLCGFGARRILRQRGRVTARGAARTGVSWPLAGLLVGLLTVGVTGSNVSVVVFAPALGMVFGLVNCLDLPAGSIRAGSPQRALAADRSGTAVVLGACALGLVAAAAMATAWTGANPIRPTATVIFGLAPGVVLGSSAWFWYVFSRCWLAARGRLPWRVMPFLEDAHRRGVLRQAGAVYQFRHARLQDRLVSRERLRRG
jgi:hypothetical protein